MPRPQADHDAAIHCDKAYKRGVHQALGLAADLAATAPTLADAQRLLTTAEQVAGDLRHNSEEHPALLDELRQRLAGVVP
jgi:hypothetical protein